MSRVFEIREVDASFIGAGRPPDLAKQTHLNEAQWREWQSLQKAAMSFGGALLLQGFRTNNSKDDFFVAAMRFVHSFVAPVSRLRAHPPKSKPAKRPPAKKSKPTSTKKARK